MDLFGKNKNQVDLELQDEPIVISDDSNFYNSADRTDESIEAEENVNIDFLKKVQQDTQKIMEQKKNNPQAAQKATKKGFFGRKKKNKGIVDLSGIKGGIDENNQDIIIVGTDSKAIKRATRVTFKTIFALIVVALLSVLVFLGLSYKFVPASVEGANYEINGYSIVSNVNVPNLNTLKKGDKVIVNNNSWSPFVVDFKLYVIKSRDGGLMHAMNAEGFTETLEATQISYILK